MGRRPRKSRTTSAEVSLFTGGLTAEEIPDKLYFRIGEVARLASIKPYVLRFWETEFTGLGPGKLQGHLTSPHRRKDVELVLEIKRLLYDQRFTIGLLASCWKNRPKAGVCAGLHFKPAKVKSP